MAIADDIARRVEESALRALQLEAEQVLGEAQRQAPIEEGTLRGSAEVEIQERDGGATAVLSFNTPYAAKQHEETSYEHPRGGKAKYLEDPIKAQAPRHAELMRQAVRTALESR